MICVALLQALLSVGLHMSIIIANLARYSRVHSKMPSSEGPFEFSHGANDVISACRGCFCSWNILRQVVA